MSPITGAVMRLVRSGRGLLPSGQLLTPEVWERRHRGIVRLLWAHVVGLAGFAVVRGYGLLHGLQEASLVAAFAVPAAHHAFTRRARSAAAVLRLALAYVVAHHTVLGILAPTQVSNHPAAEHTPWKWALIHGAFVLAASVAYLVNWRLSERQAVEISRLVSRLEGLARTDPLTGCRTGGSGRRNFPGSWSGPGGWAWGCAWP